MTAGELSEDWGEEARLRRLLAERLPRHSAPPRLREAIVGTTALAPRRSWWLAPALSALATALVMVLVGLPLLPRAAQPDPLQPIVSAVLSRHMQSLLWGESHPDVVPTAASRVMEETGISLSWFFQGDDQLQLINVEPMILHGRRALALIYKDAEGHMVTYLLTSGAGVSLPNRGRVQIDGFRPLLTKVDGFSVFVWKQQDLVGFLISDLVSEQDLSRFKEVFLKVRGATEILPTG
jgi:hypothetical protein